MKTITLKTDNNFFEKVNALAAHLHLSKSELIRRSITEYELIIKKREMEEQMRKASRLVREASRKITAEFDTAMLDGIDDA